MEAGTGGTISASTSGVSVQQTGTTGSAPAPAAAAPADWTSSLPDSAKLFVQNKGFKDPGSVVDSYQNLEKLMGAPRERLVKIPEKADAPEWGEVYDKLGRPQKATDYKMPEKYSDGKPNPEFNSWAQKQFHELGLTRAQGEALATKWGEYAATEQQKSTEAKMSQVKVEKEALHREWGAAHDQNIKACQKAAQTFGLDAAAVDKLEGALGYSATLKLLAQIGSKVAEDTFVTGGTGVQGALTPDLAIAQINELKKDTEFVRRYVAGDSEARQRMERLHRYAYPE